MPRPRERVCLQDGLKLDLNRLARQGFVRSGANIGLRGIRWTHSYWGVPPASYDSSAPLHAHAEHMTRPPVFRALLAPISAKMVRT
jgi:hypothetical protein